MNRDLMQYLLESVGVQIVFYLLYRLVLCQEKCFQYNRFYLLSTFSASIVLPFIDFSFLPVVTPLDVTADQISYRYIAADATESTRVPVVKEGMAQYLNNLLLLAYSIGVVTSLIKLACQYRQFLKMLQRQVHSCFYFEGTKVFHTDGLWPNLSFLHVIFFDNSMAYSLTEKEQILKHERVHVHHRHSYDTVFIDILRILFWFNPMIWLYKQALVDTHEYIADAEVVKATADEQAYAALLARHVLQKFDFQTGNFFNKSLTLKRINMMKLKNKRTLWVKKALIFPVLGLQVLLFSCTDATDDVTPALTSNASAEIKSAPEAQPTLSHPQTSASQELLEEYEAALTKALILDKTIVSDGHKGKLKLYRDKQVDIERVNSIYSLMTKEQKLAATVNPFIPASEQP